MFHNHFENVAVKEERNSTLAEKEIWLFLWAIEFSLNKYIARPHDSDGEFLSS